MPPRVNHIVAVVLFQSHSGMQLVQMTHHHGSTQVPKKALYHVDLCGPSHPRKLALAIFPPKASWHFSQNVIPYAFDEILSGDEDDVPSILHGVSAWVKADPGTILKSHVVDASQRTCTIISGISFLRRCAQPLASTEKAERLQMEPWTSTWKRSYRMAYCGEMAHHPRSLPCDTLRRLCCLVQEGYFLFGHQGLVHLAPRHQGVRTGQSQRRNLDGCCKVSYQWHLFASSHAVANWSSR